MQRKLNILLFVFVACLFANLMQAQTTKFYVTGDSAFVVDAGFSLDNAWQPDAIPSDNTSNDTTPTTTITQMTCSEAAAAAAQMEHNVQGTDSVAVTGYVTYTNGQISRGQQIFWMNDVNDSAQVFEGYWCNLPQDAADNNQPLNVGDHVTVKGFLKRYNDTPEIQNGDVVILERAASQIDTIETTVCEAITLGEEMNIGATTTDIYTLTGIVSSITNSNTNYYNQSFYMLCEENNKSLLAYRATIIGEFAKAGDTVFCQGKIQNYNGLIELLGQAEVIGAAPTPVDTVPEMTCDETYEPQLVDLGLPSGLMWADANIGSCTQYDYGYYFQWGCLTPTHIETWENYCYGVKDSLTKYCTIADHGTVDNLTELEPTDDAARHWLGGGWRMPTKTEAEELWDNCTRTWETNDGISGYRFTGPNGNSIFLPSNGWYDEDGMIHDLNVDGLYWTTTLYTQNDNSAFGLITRMSTGNAGVLMGPENRRYARCIRAVTDSGVVHIEPVWEEDTAVTCANEPYAWRGKTYTKTGTYYDTLRTTTLRQQDSIYYVLHLTVNPTYLIEEITSVREDKLPYIWQGETITQSGDYRKEYTASTGCDSVHTLHFTVTALPIYTVVVEADHGHVNGTGTYPEGTQIHLEAVPDEGFEFQMWSDTRTENPKNFTVMQDTTFRAHFFMPEVEQEVTVDSIDTRSVTISWDTVAGATLYELCIYKNGRLIVTFHVDRDNNIINTIFAGPERIIAKRDSTGGSAETLQVDVSGLDPGSDYTYSLDSFGDDRNYVGAQSGSFTTEDEPIDRLDTLFDDRHPEPRKVLREGRLYIEMPDGTLYDARGRLIVDS